MTDITLWWFLQAVSLYHTQSGFPVFRRKALLNPYQDVTQCRQASRHPRFEGSYFLHLHVQTVKEECVILFTGLLHLEDGSTVNLQIVRSYWLNNGLTYQTVESSAAQLWEPQTVRVFLPQTQKPIWGICRTVVCTMQKTVGYCCSVRMAFAWLFP